MAMPKQKKLFGSMEPMPEMTVKKPKKPRKAESMETFHKKRTKKMMGM